MAVVFWIDAFANVIPVVSSGQLSPNDSVLNGIESETLKSTYFVFNCAHVQLLDMKICATIYIPRALHFL